MVGEIYRPAATALLGDLVQPEQRVAAFGMYRFAINLGFAVGPATAGFLADRSFFYVFAGDALTSFVYGIVALFALPHGLRSSGKDEKPAEGLRVALSDRRFMFFLAATFCMTWVEFQLHSTFPLHIAKLGYSPATYGMLLSINGVMIVTLELLFTSWTQRFPPQRLIALGYGLTGVGLAMTGIADTIPFLAMSVVVWTIGEMVWAPVTGAFVTGLAPERYRGRYMGLWHSTWSAGLLLGPFFGTLIYQRSPNALWVTCFVVGMTAAALALVKPSHKAELESSPPPAPEVGS
jgi:predicted MFS family arabinose efflux permease